MLTRKELIAIEDALESDKARSKDSCDNRGKLRTRSNYDFISILLKKIDAMIVETEGE